MNLVRFSKNLNFFQATQRRHFLTHSHVSRAIISGTGEWKAGKGRVAKMKAFDVKAKRMLFQTNETIKI